MVKGRGQRAKRGGVRAEDRGRKAEDSDRRTEDGGLTDCKSNVESPGSTARVLNR